MSHDWKSEADRRSTLQQQQKTVERERREREAEAKRVAKEQAKQKLYEDIAAHNREVVLKEHQRTYKCQIAHCGVVSSRPNGNLHTPTGLQKCTNCGKWACEAKHYHRNYCKKCWEHYNRTGKYPFKIKKEKWGTLGIILLGIAGLPILLLSLYALIPIFIGIFIAIIIFLLIIYGLASM